MGGSEFTSFHQGMEELWDRDSKDTFQVSMAGY